MKLLTKNLLVRISHLVLAIGMGAALLSAPPTFADHNKTSLFGLGEKEGHWTETLKGGGASEGYYVNGKRHGQWVKRFADGEVYEGPYVDGKRHGKWVERFADGEVYEGPYVDGERHGKWAVQRADGAVYTATYVDGKRVSFGVDGKSVANNAACKRLYEKAIRTKIKSDYRVAVHRCLYLSSPDGLYYNALALAHGLILAKDYVQAERRFRKAAKQGHAGAQYELGMMYAEGKGVRKHYVQAYKWLSLARKQRLTRQFAILTALESKMTQQQLAEGERLVREFIPAKQ